MHNDKNPANTEPKVGLYSQDILPSRIVSMSNSAGAKVRSFKSAVNKSSRVQHTSGQIEIMGLLLIVVLFAIGVLIALYVVLSPGDFETSNRVKDSIVAQNFLTTLRKTTTTCHDRTVEELLEDCGRTRGSIMCPGGGNTCHNADDVIETILGDFFTDINRHYYFTITNIEYFENIKYGSECPREQEQMSDPIPLSVGGYNAKLTLSICR